MLSSKVVKALTNGGLRKNVGRPGRRAFLSAAFQCSEAWEARLQEPLVMEVSKPVAQFVELKRKYKEEDRVFGLDVDLLLQRVSPNGEGYNKDDIRYLLDTYQKTRFIDSRVAEADTDDHASTRHQVYRLLLESGDYSTLFSIMSQNTLYGCQPDDYTLTLMMDHFLVKGDFSRAARLASRLMLAERGVRTSTTSPHTAMGTLAVQLAAHAAVVAVGHTGDDEAWLLPKLKEAPKKVRVDFPDNPFYDDHTDIRCGTKITGKTLHWASKLDYVGSKQMRDNMRLTGAAMWQNWHELKAALEEITEISGATKAKVQEMLEKEDPVIQGSVRWAIENNVLEFPVWFDGNFWMLVNLPAKGKAELSRTSEDRRGELAGVLEKLTEVEYDVEAESEARLVEVVEQNEAKAVDEQLAAFQVWSKKRVGRHSYWLEEKNRRAELQRVEERLEDLRLREQQLNYFSNEQQIQLELSKRGKFPHPYARPSKRKFFRKSEASVAEDDYVPPSTHKNRVFAPPSRANVLTAQE